MPKKKLPPSNGGLLSNNITTSKAKSKKRGVCRSTVPKIPHRANDGSKAAPLPKLQSEEGWLATYLVPRRARDDALSKYDKASALLHRSSREESGGRWRARCSLVSPGKEISSFPCVLLASGHWNTGVLLCARLCQVCSRGWLVDPGVELTGCMGFISFL